MIDLFPYQQRDLQKINEFGGRVLLALSMGLGKEQPVDCPILTPKGWVPMGQIRVGDFVMGSSGKPIRVTGVFPQGKRRVFDVTFTDGSVVPCGKHHLWRVRTTSQKVNNKAGDVFSVDEILKRGVTRQGHAYYETPPVAPMHFSKKKFTIDPYIIGVLIGDGYLAGSSIAFSTPDIDVDIAKRVRKVLPSDKTTRRAFYEKSTCPSYRIINKNKSSYRNDFKQSVIDLGLNVLSGEKFIPAEYLLGSVEQRLDLLRGLMDTDGSCAKNRCCFYTTSKQLADDVRELVLSLGGNSRVRSYDRTAEGKGVEYSVKVNIRICPFYCKRKSAQWKADKKIRGCRIQSITDTFANKEQVCISVDAPDNLYVTANYKLTHNTRETVAWINECPEERLPALIVCPAIVKPNWEVHFRELTQFHPNVLEGQKPGKKQQGMLSQSVAIINYDIVSFWLEPLLKRGFRTLVLDEGQYCKNPSARRTKACRQLAKTAKYVFDLSGTPLMNRPRELWPVLNMIRPDLFPKFWDFGQRYCNPKLTPWGWRFDGATNLPELHQRLRDTCMIRHLKSEVLPDLPEIIRETLPIQLSAESMKEYNMAQFSFMNWLKMRDAAKAMRAKHAMEICKLGELKRLAARLKLRFVVDWINHWLEEADPSEKLVVFAIHRGLVQILKEHCKSKSIVIDGSVGSSQRKELVKQFRTDNKTRLCIGNIDSMGTGVDGLQVASTAVMAELHWNPKIHEQAESRLHRIGAKSTVWVYYLIAAQTIEEHLCRVIQHKQQIVTAVLDGAQAETEFNVYSQLTKALTHEAHRIADRSKS